LDPRGRIYVVDPDNQRVVRIDDMQGNGWTALSSADASWADGFLPKAIAIDELGRIVLMDYLHDQLVRMEDLTGSNWITLGSTGSSRHQFLSAAGITTDRGLASTSPTPATIASFVSTISTAPRGRPLAARAPVLASSPPRPASRLMPPIASTSRIS